MHEPTRTSTVRHPVCPRRAVRGMPLLVLTGVFAMGPSGAAIAEPCLAATVTASPKVINYKTVIQDWPASPPEPGFTVFIELPDGSACSGEGCVDPHRTVQKRMGDWILTGQ